MAPKIFLPCSEKRMTVFTSRRVARSFTREWWWWRSSCFECQNASCTRIHECMQSTFRLTLQSCQDTENQTSSKPHLSSGYPLRLENGGVNLLSFRRNPLNQPPPQPSMANFYSFQNGSGSDVPNFSSLPLSFKGISVTNLDSANGPTQYATLPRKSSSRLSLSLWFLMSIY